MMNTLGSRLTMVEERRQESDAADARMKSDLDQRLVQSQTDLESLQSELEQQIQSLQTSVDSIKTSVQNQRAEIDFSLVELRNTANENEVGGDKSNVIYTFLLPGETDTACVHHQRDEELSVPGDPDQHPGEDQPGQCYGAGAPNKVK